MAVASGDGVEKLEDMIVRAAESTSAHVKAAKDAIGAVIFGQDMVVERALVTVLSGGHGCWSACPASPRPCWSGRWESCSGSTSAASSSPPT